MSSSLAGRATPKLATWSPRAPSTAWLIVGTLVLGACAPVPGPSVDDPGEAVGGSPARAAAIVEEWLTEAREATDDRGWSLLDPTVRTDLIGSEEAYRDAIHAADWSRFAAEIVAVDLRDGEYWVRLHLPGGVESVPRSIRDWGLVQVRSTDGIAGEEGIVIVFIHPSGWPFGIQATG